MFTAKGPARPIGSGFAAGTLLGTVAASPAAWPMPLTSARTTLWNTVGGRFTGERDQPPLIGACRQLCTGESTSAVSGATTDQDGCGR